MHGKVLMFQGTGSDVGKSTLVAGLCRLAYRRGIKVAPFKPQNMSNNAAVCKTGGEIGRAQALQARACNLALHTDFNPVLIKPTSDRTAQIIVQGKALHEVSASDYMLQQRGKLKDAVVDSFGRLISDYELVLVEGAGSPAEINLRAHDIANMGFARAVQSPVCLIGDIDRGGVIAAIAGTKQVIDPEDAALISSFIVNKFRGDPELFVDGVKAIEALTDWPCYGVVPWLSGASKLPQEDAVVLDDWHQLNTHSFEHKVTIAIPMLSRIANFDDFDPLRSEPKVQVIMVPPGKPIPARVDAIIIPGTKSTMGDLDFLRNQGWHHDIIAASRNGVRVLGICGGYQMLGNYVYDEKGVDGVAGQTRGLGLLDVDTHMSPQKRTVEISGHCCRSGHVINGYEIHMGSTSGLASASPFVSVGQSTDGAVNEKGSVEGCYIHGIFNNDDFRSWWLDSLQSNTAAHINFDLLIDKELDAVADGLESALDIESLLGSARPAVIH